MATEIQYDKYLNADPTPLMEHIAEWLKEKTGWDPKTARTKEDAFRMGVFLTVHLRNHHQTSPENQARLDANRRLVEAEEAERAQRRAEREALGVKARGRIPRAALLAAQEAAKKTRGRAAAKPKAAAKEEPKPRTRTKPAAAAAAKPPVGKPATKRRAPAKAAAPAPDVTPTPDETPAKPKRRTRKPIKDTAPSIPDAAPAPEPSSKTTARRRRRATASTKTSAPPAVSPTTEAAPDNVTPIRRRRAAPRQGEAAF